MTRESTTQRAWTPPSRALSAYLSVRRTHSESWPTIKAEHLLAVSEPLRWKLRFGDRAPVRDIEALLRNAAVGPNDASWRPPNWLLPHQITAARRIKASIEVFRGALLADAVGLGKTYVALAVASRYARTTVVLPAALLSQWKQVSARFGVAIKTVTHEALSRMERIPTSDLLVVDEAHRFRNPNTRRYERLACAVKQARVLLLTATPVVNRPSDLAHLIRLFCSDNAFALFGMPSIEQAISGSEYTLLTRAMAPAIVARSPESIGDLMKEIPAVSDRAVVRKSPVEPSALRSLLAIIAKLQFPSVAQSQERELMRLHLLFRLASSLAAFKNTVKRHLAYTDRAIDASNRGEFMSRSLARQIFANDAELQLALGDIAESSQRDTVDPNALRADRVHLATLSKVISSANGHCPKATALERILKERAGRKTIIFTTAIATAQDMARRLKWKEIAVVGGGKSWIASGKLPVEEALALFAPRARGKPQPHKSLRLNTLIATDLASEGLNLQDADAVVHYDLPWTPLKLEQRVGRIARLGSMFRSAQVYWFAPPMELDDRLKIESRIDRKASDQIGLLVPTTSRLGRARIVNHELKRRERLGGKTRPLKSNGPLFAVVRGPACAVIAIRWRWRDFYIPELITLSGDRLQKLSGFEAAEHIVNQLTSATPVQCTPPKTLVDALLEILRTRLSMAQRGTHSLVTRRLSRHVLRLAYAASKKRERQLLETFDRVLEKLRMGVNSGGERSLATLLTQGSSRVEFEKWLDGQPTLPGRFPRFEIIAALFGDGSTASR